MTAAPGSDPRVHARAAGLGVAPSGGASLRVDDVSLTFRGARTTTALEHLTLEVAPREVVALIGPNGCGKSTLLRVISGTLAPLQGSASTLVPSAVLDQDGGDALPPDASLLERLRALDCPLPGSELRTRLAQLRLDAKRVVMPMGLLSAGERLKAALACALWRREPARMLLLDEPTNHLDLDTTLMLQVALQRFEGALIVASHDVEFIAALRPTHRWEWRDGHLVMRQSSVARVDRESARGCLQG